MKVTAFIRQKQVAKNNTTDKSTIFSVFVMANLTLRLPANSLSMPITGVMTAKATSSV